MLTAGVFVDWENMQYGGGRRMQFAAITRLIRKHGYEVAKAIVYMAYDAEAEARNDFFRIKGESFRSALKHQGYTPYLKRVKTFADGTSKANADVDLAVDAVSQCKGFDSVWICSGDGDFEHLVTVLQMMGKRVCVLSMLGTSSSLVRTADLHIQGLLYPELVPTPQDDAHENPEDWYRGTISKFIPDRGYGFIRVADPLDDSRMEFEDMLFFHVSELSSNGMAVSPFCESLHHDRTVVEFLVKQGAKGLVAANIRPFMPPMTRITDNRFQTPENGGKRGLFSVPETEEEEDEDELKAVN